jgi:hypothetical protein
MNWLESVFYGVRADGCARNDGYKNSKALFSVVSARENVKAWDIRQTLRT